MTYCAFGPLCFYFPLHPKVTMIAHPEQFSLIGILLANGVHHQAAAPVRRYGTFGRLDLEVIRSRIAEVRALPEKRFL